MDFVADQLVNGTRFRALTIVDVYTREALDIVVADSVCVAKTSWRLVID
jgi:putative transposase